MVVNVVLGANKFTRLPENIVVSLPEDALRVAFTSPIYPLGMLSIIARNGNDEKRYKTTGAAIDLTELCTHAGVIELEVSLIAKGAILKSWSIEGILLKEINSAVEAIPEMVAMRSELELMRKALTEIYHIVKHNTEI